MKAVFDYSYSTIEIENINEMAKQPSEFIRQCENSYQQQIDMLIRVLKKRPNCRVLLLSGPSSSGKTTTAHKISQSLSLLDIRAPVISLDDFYLGVEHYPKLEDGTPDMETIEALDLALINDTISKLITQGTARFPVFNFEKSERSTQSNEIHFRKNDILILEGLHALNPKVLNILGKDQLFRVYISTRTVYTLLGKVILAPKDMRLIRRTSRDYYYRGNEPAKTLHSWKDVLDGEEKYIYPFRDNSDFKIDSSLDYEACVFHHYILPLIQSLKDNRACSVKVHQIIEILEAFDDIDNSLIPKDSLLREFIGKD
jgi:uridine kinase